jgi:hypothetical protein
MQKTTSNGNTSTSVVQEETSPSVVVKMNVKPKKSVKFTEETEDNEFKEMKTSKSKESFFLQFRVLYFS